MYDLLIAMVFIAIVIAPAAFAAKSSAKAAKE
jgi:hypothetical protein